MKPLRLSRRQAITLGAGGLAGAGLAAYPLIAGSAPRSTAAEHDITVSRRDEDAGSTAAMLPSAPGESVNWAIGTGGHKISADIGLNLAAYASTDSVGLGESIGFHLSATPAQMVTAQIFRLGGPLNTAAHMATSPPFEVASQAVPTASGPTRTVTCEWPAAWHMTVPRTWSSGIYVAAFTGNAGYQTYATFVVRDDARHAEIQVIVPTTTYQAYNMFRFDGSTGASLYHAWNNQGRWVGEEGAATRVSFDRPYISPGLPSLFELDRFFAEWAHSRGLDMKFATSIDLHAGRIDHSSYRTMVFSGHDEYWSQQMRSQVEHAAGQGRNLAFMAANNIYWHIRLQDFSHDEAATVTCYKHKHDPAPDHSGVTMEWREIDRPEQEFLGAQYAAVVPKPRPLVVRNANHWLWRGTGVREGDAIPNIVGGEADSVDPNVGRPRGSEFTVLAASPYQDVRGTAHQQNTVIHRHPAGGLVFVAGTFFWTRGLADPTVKDARIQAATANLFDAFGKA